MSIPNIVSFGLSCGPWWEIPRSEPILPQVFAVTQSSLHHDNSKLIDDQ
jgi:hypothetical protein